MNVRRSVVQHRNRRMSPTEVGTLDHHPGETAYVVSKEGSELAAWQRNTFRASYGHTRKQQLK